VPCLPIISHMLPVFDKPAFSATSNNLFLDEIRGYRRSMVSDSWVSMMTIVSVVLLPSCFATICSNPVHIHQVARVASRVRVFSQAIL